MHQLVELEMKEGILYLQKEFNFIDLFILF